MEHAHIEALLGSFNMWHKEIVRINDRPLIKAITFRLFWNTGTYRSNRSTSQEKRMVDVRAVTLEVGCSKFVGRRRISSTVPLSFLSYNVTGGSGYGEAYNYRYRNGDHKSWALLSLTRFLLFLPRVELRVSPRVENEYGWKIEWVNWIKSSPHFSDVDRLHFLRQKFPFSYREPRDYFNKS